MTPARCRSMARLGYGSVGVVVLLCRTCLGGADLEYVNSWVGNTFGGRDGHFVQHATHTLFVAPDGTCFMNTPWEEGGNQVGVYRAGEHLCSAEHTHGWGANGGFAVTANDKYVYIAHTMGNEGGHLYDIDTDSFPPKGKTWFGISRRTRESIGREAAPFPGGHGQHGAVLKECYLVVNEVSSEKPIGDMFGPAQIRGLALDSQGRLFASNPYNTALKEQSEADDTGRYGEIMIYDGESMALLGTWPCPSSGPIAIGPDDTLWVIQSEGDGAHAARVLHLTLDGEPLPHVIVDLDEPSALAVDRHGRILVAENGRDQQVRIYETRGDEVQLVSTLGEQGGIWSGIAGKVGPQRFNGIVGVGADAQDNVYVACGGKKGQAVTLEAYRPDGKRNWALYGLLFVDCGAPDAATGGEHYYTAHEHYSVDFGQPPGQEWSYVGYTHDPWRHERHPSETVWLRRIEGKRVLFSTAMGPDHLLIHRLEDEDEIAVPAGRFYLGAETDQAGGPPIDAPTGRWIWRDANGNGRYDADEYAGDGERDPATWAWWPDQRGHIWQGYEDCSAILELPCEGLDEAGNPVYSRERAVAHELPPPFSREAGGRRLQRVLYLPEADVMLLSGYTEQVQSEFDWKSIGPVLCCYDDWSGEKHRRWRLVFPMDHVSSTDPYRQPHRYPMSFEVAGDYLFLVQCTPAHVHVFRMDTGAWCGMMKPGPEVGEGSGWVDVPYGLRALKRPDGEYIVWVEEDWRGKNMMYRWRPKAQAPTAAPADVVAQAGFKKAVLSWAPVAGATGYVVRRAVRPEGPYEILWTGFTGPQCDDTGIPEDAVFYYTIQAANDGGLGPISAPVERHPPGPRPAENPARTVPGAAYEYYEGDWNRLPDFSALEAKSTGTVSSFDIPPHESEDAFGFRIRGYLDVPTDGEYTFFLTSDDGSRLLIGDDVVVDNDGTHGTQERSETIALQAGKHAVTVLFFEKSGGESLRVEWSGPGSERRPIPAERVWRVPRASAASPWLTTLAGIYGEGGDSAASR